MTRPNIQIGDEVREMNDEEFAVYEAQQAEYKKQEKALKAKDTARKSALDKLSELGLTKAEIEALLSR